MDGVVVGSAGGAGTNHLGGRQTVDLSIVLGDSGLDLGILLQNGGEVGHYAGISDVGRQVDEGAAPAMKPFSKYFWT